jgi:hypothetical protein
VAQETSPPLLFRSVSRRGAMFARAGNLKGKFPAPRLVNSGVISISVFRELPAEKGRKEGTAPAALILRGWP